MGDPGRGTEVEGVIEAVLPQALFRVRCDGGAQVVASLSAEARRITVKFLPGDRVTLRLSPYDPGRGRILRRF